MMASIPLGRIAPATRGSGTDAPPIRHALPEGATVDQVLADPALEEQIRFIGGVFAEPGGTAYLGLEGLELGVYTVVSFVDVAEGVPHVLRGMVAGLMVE